jgi:hypothetical protein
MIEPVVNIWIPESPESGPPVRPAWVREVATAAERGHMWIPWMRACAHCGARYSGLGGVCSGAKREP